MLQENESIIRALLTAGAGPEQGAANLNGRARAALDLHADAESKLALTPLESFRIPVGGQEIALQQLDYVHGGASLLRLRIREGRRFTIFDLDATSARHWGEALIRWAERQER